MSLPIDREQLHREAERLLGVEPDLPEPPPWLGDPSPDPVPDPVVVPGLAAAKRSNGGGAHAQWIDGAAVFDPQDPVPFVVPQLYICPGRHVQIQGYGYSGKTVAAQALAIAVATDKPVWGQFRVRAPGIVGHLDYEQGRRATLRRYLRLARAMGVTREDLARKLKILCLPSVRLSDAESEAWLTRECAGMTLCLIDSLRATILGIDENDSTIRAFLDKLLRVSEATGCTFVLIHHAGKGRSDGDQREAGRGSSAIFDSAGTVLKLSLVEHNEPQVTICTVRMTKATADADGGAVEPFHLRIEDVSAEDAADPKWGLRCVYQTKEQVAAPMSRAQQRRALERELLAAIVERPGLTTTEALDAVPSVRVTTKRAALDALERATKIRVEPGPRRSLRYYATEAPAGVREGDDGDA
jgi:hypothetical protein